MKKQKENSHEGITWSEMWKQNVQGKKVYWTRNVSALSIVKCLQRYSWDRILSWFNRFLPFSFSCSCYCGRRRSIIPNPVLEPTEIEMLANMLHLVSMPKVWIYSFLPGTTSLCNASGPALSLTCFVSRAFRWLDRVMFWSLFSKWVVLTKIQTCRHAYIHSFIH